MEESREGQSSGGSPTHWTLVILSLLCRHQLQRVSLAGEGLPQVRLLGEGLASSYAFIAFLRNLLSCKVLQTEQLSPSRQARKLAS